MENVKNAKTKQVENENERETFLINWIITQVDGEEIKVAYYFTGKIHELLWS